MKLALFSVTYAGFWGQDRLPLEELPAKSRSLGYDGVMLMAKRPHAFPADMGPDRRADFRSRLHDHGQELACVGAYTSFTAGSECGEVPLLDLQVDYVAACARLASDLDCRLLRIFTGYEVAGLPFSRQWESCVHGIRACCDAAAPFGVTIGVQNHHDIGAHTASLQELLRDVDRPNCAPCLDAWSPALRGEDLAAAGRAVGGRTPQTIVADYVRLPRTRYRPDLVDYESIGPDAVRAVPVGEGCIDYRSFIGGLHAGGFDGWIIYEMCSVLRGGGSMTNLDGYARHFVDYMRRLTAELPAGSSAKPGQQARRQDGTRTA
jgi:sugar phosphate isomerase/epimerase